MKIAVVTGGSSGIGLETVKSLLENNCRVYELSRRKTDVSGAVHISTDVTDENAVNEAVGQIIKKENRIDILINCAGSGISGAVEFTDLQDAKRQFDVNFFGIVNMVKAVLPYMRKQKSGRIINISSVAGVAPIPFQSYYSAAKAAVNSYTSALANEVKPFGITASAIMPGDIKTGFTSARKKTVDGDMEYDGRISRSVSKMEHDETNGMSPHIAGRYICKAALKKSVKPMCSIGFTYKALSLLAKLLPCSARDYLIYKLYG